MIYYTDGEEFTILDQAKIRANEILEDNFELPFINIYHDTGEIAETIFQPEDDIEN